MIFDGAVDKVVVHDDYNPNMDDATHQFLLFVEGFLETIKPLEAIHWQPS